MTQPDLFKNFPSDALIRKLCCRLEITSPDEIRDLWTHLRALPTLKAILEKRDPYYPNERIDRIEKAKEHFVEILSILKQPLDPITAETKRETPEFDTAWHILDMFADDDVRNLDVPTSVPERSKIRLKGTIEDLKKLVDAAQSVIDSEQKRKILDPTKRRKSDNTKNVLVADLGRLYTTFVEKRPGFSHPGSGQELDGPFLRFVLPILQELGFDGTKDAIRSRYRRLPDDIKNPPDFDDMFDPREMALAVLPTMIMEYDLGTKDGAGEDVDYDTGNISGGLLEYLRPLFEKFELDPSDDEVRTITKRLVKTRCFGQWSDHPSNKL